MRVETPEISWHNTTPVYSCDIQPKIKECINDSWVRLASCGRDNCIRMWKVPNSTAKPQFISCLRRHEKPVNVVRFIPTGEDVLASGGDDGLVILWKKDTSSTAASASSRTLFGQDADEDEECSEVWQVNRVLRRHLEDVYDLSWSVDGHCLISGSVDHSAIEWNLKSGQQLLLKDHKQYVQGVAWDPLDEFVLSMGSDRSCRVYRVGSRNCSYNIVRHDKQRLFQDDSWKSFFRRLTFSPDGSLLICPAGCHGVDGHSAYVFTRQSLPSPVLALPTENRPVIAIRFCPSPFCLPKGATPLFALPYMWVFCLVLEDGILVYNTSAKYPIAYIGAIHYQALNDAAWSVDGRILTVCSTDGYCSVVQFDAGELGQLYVSEKPVATVGVPCANTMSSNETRKNTSDNEVKKTVANKDNVVKETKMNVAIIDNQDKTLKNDRETDKKVSDKPIRKKGITETKEIKVSHNAPKLRTEGNKATSKSDDLEADGQQSENPLKKVDCEVDVQMDVSDPAKETSGVLKTAKPESPLPAKKKRRVTFVTLETSSAEKDEPMETSVAISTQSAGIEITENKDVTPRKRRVALVTLSNSSTDIHEPMETTSSPGIERKEDKEKIGDKDGTPRKRRVAITTISSEPLGEQSSSPLQPMKRRVAFTTLTSEVSPDEITDNLSNMSAPEFNLTLEDSMSEKKVMDENVD